MLGRGSARAKCSRPRHVFDHNTYLVIYLIGHSFLFFVSVLFFSFFVVFVLLFTLYQYDILE